MSTTKTETADGIGFFGLLTIVFVTLKLTNYISWSWWLVLLPIWWWIPLLVSTWLGYILLKLFIK